MWRGKSQVAATGKQHARKGGAAESKAKITKAGVRPVTPTEHWGLAIKRIAVACDEVREKQVGLEIELR